MVVRRLARTSWALGKTRRDWEHRPQVQATRGGIHSLSQSPFVYPVNSAVLNCPALTPEDTANPRVLSQCLMCAFLWGSKAEPSAPTSRGRPAGVSQPTHPIPPHSIPFCPIPPCWQWPIMESLKGVLLPQTHSRQYRALSHGISGHTFKTHIFCYLENTLRVSLKH